MGTFRLKKNIGVEDEVVNNITAGIKMMYRVRCHWNSEKLVV